MDDGSAHTDRFVLDRLPPRELWPHFDLSALPGGVTYPDRINVAATLLNDAIEAGHGPRPALHYGSVTWSYDQLNQRVNQIARTLSEDFGLEPGNRVLLRGPNTLMMVASWLGVIKAGGICITTVPLLRAGELQTIIGRIAPRIALCDFSVRDELIRATGENSIIEHIGLFSDYGDGNVPDACFDQTVLAKPAEFTGIDTHALDPAIAAFTSGTTGIPKCAIHFHRNLMVATDCFPRDIWDIKPEHVFSGTPPIAFTFGLGAFILIPLRFGASVALVQTPTPENLLATIAQHKVTDLYTAPTMFRRMLPIISEHDITSLKHCNSAGEHLPLDTLQKWHDATGLSIVDQLGSTELLHNFLAARPGEAPRGATGRPCQGFEAKLVDDFGNIVETPDEIGRLAVRGPNGCIYFDDPERQKIYVQNGWNLTGDLMHYDDGGHLWYDGRADDLIISSGYNISGLEIEQILMSHEHVNECAVIGVPDDERGNVVKAFIVPASLPDDEGQLARELQNFVKASIAPYKYPRAISFLEALPRTPTGKVQRFKLREM